MDKNNHLVEEEILYEPFRNHEINVLVTGVGSQVGQGVIKALRLSKYKCNIIGCDMNHDSAGFLMCDDYQVIPAAVSANYLDEIINLCKNKNINIIFPTADAELKKISKGKSLFRDIGVIPIVQPEKILDIFQSKYKTYSFLRNSGITVPETLHVSKKNIEKLISTFGFPIIFKPDFGQGSKSIYVVNNDRELNFCLDNIYDGMHIVQQYISSEDEEYTCAVFNCDFIKEPYVIVFKRTLEIGVSWTSEVVIDEDIISLCKKVSDIIGLEGSINIQLRKFKNKHFIFEINPRYSSTTGIRSNCGFNDVEMAIDYFLFKKIPVLPEIHKKKALRYLDEIYVDLE